MHESDARSSGDGPSCHDDGIERRKRELRVEFRSIRRAVTDAAARSDRIWAFLAATVQYRAARSVLLFDSIVGEPITGPWKDAARRDDKAVWVPEDPHLPDVVDLVVVPGVAFTPGGERLGQGGGWYDRYLAGVKASAYTIGVCFCDQLVGSLPTEAHDHRVQLVICERGVAGQNDAIPGS